MGNIGENPRFTVFSFFAFFNVVTLPFLLLQLPADDNKAACISASRWCLCSRRPVWNNCGILPMRQAEKYRFMIIQISFLLRLRAICFWVIRFLIFYRLWAILTICAMARWMFIYNNKWTNSKQII